MKIELIEANVDQTLELRGLVKEGNEQQVRLLLYHLYVSVSIWNLMTFTDKMNTLKWKRFLNDVFTLKNYLKKRTKKKAKEAPLPAPTPQEKESKEKEVETPTPQKENKEKVDEVVRNDLVKRKKAFFDECQQFVERYGREVVEDFYVYWSEESARDKKMLWEYQRTWSTAKRLFKWSRNSISDAKKEAAIKLARAEKKNAQQATVSKEQKQIAAQREADNARREKELAESKASAVSMEEVTQGDPNRLSTLNKLLATKFTASP